MPPSTLRLHHGAILGSATIRITVSSYRQPRPPPQRRLRCYYGHYNFNCNCSTTTILRHRQPLPLQRRRRQQQHHHLRAFTAQAPSSSFFSPAARSSSIYSLFQRIETNYGNLSSLIDTGSRGETIAVEDGIIRPHHLVRLMTHEATALHIRNFYDAECAKRLGRELSMMNEYPQRQQGGIGSVVVGNGNVGGGSARKNWKINTPRGLESSDVMTVGEHMPYNVAYSSSSSSSVAMQEYHHRSGKKHVGGPSGLGGGGGGNSSSDHPMIPSPIDEYFEGVQRELRLRRQPKKVVLVNDNSSSNNDLENHYCYHPLWPLDKLRLELEEAWPSGAGLAREGQPTKQRMTTTITSDNNAGSTINNEWCFRYPRPYGGGLPRIMQGPTRWKRGFIHVDELGPLDDTRGLFSANIYLTVPESLSLGSIDSTSSDYEDWKKDAGALHVWPLGVRSRWDWYRNAVTLSSLSSQDPELQHNLRVKLGKPNVIRPEPGDLVLLCAQRPHCAVGFERGVRVSLQCFLSHSGLDKRLLIDC